MLTPPRVPENLRTGWAVEPGNPQQLAAAISSALALETASYRALATRARQFAEFMFSPEGAAAATLEVYASLLQSKR
jgi:glycosyltransferase involved in cell wall biosynthesis